jgi:hypothetical protein
MGAALAACAPRTGDELRSCEGHEGEAVSQTAISRQAAAEGVQRTGFVSEAFVPALHEPRPQLSDLGLLLLSAVWLLRLPWAHIRLLLHGWARSERRGLHQRECQSILIGTLMAFSYQLQASLIAFLASTSAFIGSPIFM